MPNPWIALLEAFWDAPGLVRGEVQGLVQGLLVFSVLSTSPRTNCIEGFEA